MKIIALLVVLLVCSVGLSSATSTYSIATNTITVVDGTNYPWTVYSDVSNSTAFDRTGNESIMTANMVINLGATLYIDDETFNFNCSSNGEYGIVSNGATLNINNSTITSVNPTYHGWIVCDSPSNNFPTIVLTNSTISEMGYSNGVYSGIYISEPNFFRIEDNEFYNSYSGLYFLASENTSQKINNNTFHDLDEFCIHGSSAIISNNTIYNIDTTLSVLYYVKGTIEHNTIYNITGGTTVIHAKESANAITRFNTIYNIAGTAINHHYSGSSNGIIYSYNNNIINVSKGIAIDCAANTVVNICNNTINNSGVGQGTTGIEISDDCEVLASNNSITNFLNGIYLTTYNGDATISNLTVIDNEYGNRFSVEGNILLRNVNFINSGYCDIYVYGGSGIVSYINSNWDSTYFRTGTLKLLKYYYKDVNVTTESGSVIENASVTFFNSVDNSSYPCIDCAGNAQSVFTTISNGHTQYPSNAGESPALLDFWQNISTKIEMEWIISADAGGYAVNNSAITGLNLTSGYYRSEPNTYQNTSTIILFEVETFIVAAGAFAAVIVAGAAVASRRVRRGVSGFWNRRIRRR